MVRFLPYVPKFREFGTNRGIYKVASTGIEPVFKV